jgi:hypothetical protein
MTCWTSSTVGMSQGTGKGPPQCGQRRDHRPRQKEDSITVGTSGLDEAGGTARSSAPVQDLPSVNNARDPYSWEIRINTARKCERPRRSLYDDMAEAVQDGGERGVQDGADRLEAVTALASRRSVSTIANAAVSRRARAIHPTVDRVPSLHTHRAGYTGPTGCPAVRRPVK